MVPKLGSSSSDLVLRYSRGTARSCPSAWKDVRLASSMPSSGYPVSAETPNGIGISGASMGDMGAIFRVSQDQNPAVLPGPGNPVVLPGPGNPAARRQVLEASSPIPAKGDPRFDEVWLFATFGLQVPCSLPHFFPQRPKFWIGGKVRQLRVAFHGFQRKPGRQSSSDPTQRFFPIMQQ